MAERIKLGGLWQNKSKDGTDYLSGKLSPTVKILIFKNNYKQPGDNSPTHIMYLAPLDPDPNAQRGAEQADSFFGGGDLNAASDDNGGGGGGEGEGEDDFAPAPPARPQTQAPRPATAAGRSNAPAPQAASRPMNAQSTNTRPAQNGAPQPAPRRQPAPAAQPPTDDIGDFEDPFGE